MGSPEGLRARKGKGHPRLRSLPRPGTPVEPRVRRLELARDLAVVVDLFAIVAAYWLTLQGWKLVSPELAQLAPIPFGRLLLKGLIVPPITLLVPLWCVIAYRMQLYNPQRNVSTPRILRDVTEAVAVFVVGVVLVEFLLPQQHFSRTAAAMLGFTTLISVGAVRLLIFWGVQAAPLRGVQTQHVAIIGTGPVATHLAERVRSFEWLGFELVGFIEDDRTTDMSGGPFVDPERVLGDLDELRDLVNVYNLHYLVLSDFAYPRMDAVRLAVDMERMGVQLLKVPYSHGVVSSRIATENIGDLELEAFRPVQYTAVAYRVKCVFDVVAVIAGGIFILPPLLVVAALIKLDSRGPTLFVDRRFGKGGRVFPFYKFRSMVANAADLRHDLDKNNESDGLLFKMTHDPRITRVGRFIRKYSVDEFPQLINVLIGDMNLVGPRPLPVTDLDNIDDNPEWRYWFEQRCNVKPGITGLWQVLGRSDLGFERMVELDIYYIENWSLWLDIQILLKTLPVVISGRGAR